MKRIAEVFEMNGETFSTLKFVNDKIDPYISLMKDCKLKLINSNDIFPTPVHQSLLCAPKFPDEYKGTFKEDKIWNEDYGLWLTKEQLEKLEKDNKFKHNLTEVKLLIDFDESDEILLGELDNYLTQKFKMKKIEIGKENLNYRK